MVCLADSTHPTSITWRTTGGIMFRVVVTYRRRRFLTSDLARTCLHEAIEKVHQKWPFEIVAIVLLPDHWHTACTLPRGDSRYSLRLQKIKEAFTRSFLGQGGRELRQSRSRRSWHARRLAKAFLGAHRR